MMQYCADKLCNLLVTRLISITKSTAACYYLAVLMLALCPQNSHQWERDIIVTYQYECPKSPYLVRHLKDWSFNSQAMYTYFSLDTEERNFVRQVRNAIFSIVSPIPLKHKAKLIAASTDVVMNILDMYPTIVHSWQFVQFVSGNIVLDHSIPLSHRYGGHQFGYWAGQLGDGRATMLGEYINMNGERWELQLKGSGKTPYSRDGDGRAVLRSSIREFLCSEAMHALGIPTSRAASVISSKDPVMRDQFYNGHPKKEPAAVVLRLAKSWFRIGSLEILTVSGEHSLLKRLVDHIIKEHFPHISTRTDNKYVEFFRAVLKQTSLLVAQWMSVGFAHGVCNTDNFSILSITIDYGPFGFLDTYDLNYVPNTSDDEGRYRFGRQPEVAAFNLEKLRLSLLPLVTDGQAAMMKDDVSTVVDVIQAYTLEIMYNKTGLATPHEDNERLVALWLRMMRDRKADYTISFRQLAEISVQDLADKKLVRRKYWALTPLTYHALYTEFVSLYAKLTAGHGERVRKRVMLQANPRYVLRNWMAQQAIEEAERGEYTRVKQLLRVLSDPFREQEDAELAGYADPPPEWASKIKVSCSS